MGLRRVLLEELAAEGHEVLNGPTRQYLGVADVLFLATQAHFLGDLFVEIIKRSRRAFLARTFFGNYLGLVLGHEEPH